MAMVSECCPNVDHKFSFIVVAFIALLGLFTSNLKAFPGSAGIKLSLFKQMFYIFC